MSTIPGDAIEKERKIASILDQLRDQEELVASIERRLCGFTRRMFNYTQKAIHESSPEDPQQSATGIMFSRIGRTQQVLQKISIEVDEMIAELPVDERTKEPTRT
jgi:hypothetical protein